MTVSYQYEVASSTSGGFTRLLFMWRGSLYKLIYRELLLFLIAFGLLSALYRNAFTLEQKRLFEKVVIYCDTFINLIPLSFVLGFYVAYVAGRWWQQFMAIPWPDKVMHTLALYVGGNDEQARILRRTLMRYLNLSLILVLRSISSAVKRRLPTMEHLVEAGFMTRIELEMFNAVPNLEFNTYWIPCTWFISHLKEARRQNKITDPQGLKLLMEEFNEFRSKCGLLWSYDWISIPLVYTQVVTLATYSFFLAALVGRQYVEEAKKQLQMEIDIYLPVFTILQFFFFMGLLKVAEQLINPFGDDDEDFELNWLIDRHTKVSYLGVDTLMEKAPPLLKDKYFDDVNLTLPYTGAAVAYKKKTYRGSVHNMMVPEDQQSMFLPDITEEDETDSIHNQKNTPKHSFSNLFSGPSTGSVSAGIWRQSGDSIDIERMAGAEEIAIPVQELSAAKVRNFVRKVPRLPTPIVKDKKFITFPELQQWSSNSTLDSYCSVNNAVAESSFETPTDEVVEEKETNKKKKVKRKRTESQTSLRSMGCLPNLSIRRLSNTSGQWKGIRWKPVLENKPEVVEGESLPPLPLRRASDDIGQAAVSSELCSRCQVEGGELRRYTLPESLSQRHKCEAFHRGCRAYNFINPTLSSSLPNIQLSDSSSDEYIDGEE